MTQTFSSPDARSASAAAARALLALALALPFLWPLDPGPSAKLGSMLVAAGLWSLALLVAAWSGTRWRASAASAIFLMLALVIATQTAFGQLAYPTQGISSAALLVGAACVAALGAGVARDARWVRLVCAALVAQGLGQVAVGMLQFAFWQLPTFAQWISAHAAWVYQIVSFPGDGRIFGNLRQPNHFATALALGAAGLAGLAPGLRPRAIWTAAALLAWGLVASASRTGAVHTVIVTVLVLLAVPRAWRDPRWRPLLALPALYGAWWAVMQLAGHFGLIAAIDALSRELSQPVNARGIIWSNAWQAFSAHPLTGWGWGQIGWALERSAVAGNLHPLPLDNIDNAHDLVLQLLVDTGLAGTLPVVAVALAWAWRVLRAWTSGAEAAARRIAALPALLGVAFIGFHSLVEYPLWYVYFLFAFAWLLGWAEGAASDARHAAHHDAAHARRVRRAAVILSALAVLFTAKATRDYVLASEVYGTDADTAEQAAQDMRDTGLFFVSLAEFPQADEILPSPGADRATLLEDLAVLERASHAWGDPSLLSRRIVVLLRLGRVQEAEALARYTAHAFWLYAPQTTANFATMAAQAGVQDKADVARILAILREAPVIRRITVPRR